MTTPTPAALATQARDIALACPHAKISLGPIASIEHMTLLPSACPECVARALDVAEAKGRAEGAAAAHALWCHAPTATGGECLLYAGHTGPHGDPACYEKGRAEGIREERERWESIQARAVMQWRYDFPS